MTEPASTADLARSARKARTFGWLTLLVVLVLLLTTIGGYATAAQSPELMGFPLTLTVLTLLAALLVVLAFQSAARLPDTQPLSGPLRLITILAFVVGAAGALITAIIGVFGGSAMLAIVDAVALFVIGLVLFTLGSLLYRFVIPAAR